MLGLLAGLLLPDLALALRPHLPLLIATLLFVSALRIGPRAAYGGISDLGQSVWIVLLYQGIAPRDEFIHEGSLGLKGKEKKTEEYSLFELSLSSAMRGMEDEDTIYSEADLNEKFG